MIKRKTKICEQCGKNVFIYSKKRCLSCYMAHRQKREQMVGTKTKKKASKKIKQRKPTGEAQLFRIIWEKRPHVCSHCKIYLGDEARAHFFSHIISKKKEPKLRLEESNIWLLCFDCHFLYDFGTKDQFNKRKMTH